MARFSISQLPAAEPLDGTELVDVSQLSPTVTITATTIGALASDNAYVDSADGFVAAGFAAGDRVKVTGFTGNVANNIFVGVITELLADKMTIGGTDGDVIVDDAEGESVTITKWMSRRTTVGDILGLAPTAAAVKYRIGFSIEGTTPAAGEVLMRHVLQTDVDFANDFAGSIARQDGAASNPASDQDFDILHEGVSIGTVTLDTAGAVAWVTAGGALSGLSGEEIRIEAPAAPDAEIVGMSFIVFGEEA